ncbi:hypothetical protein GEMRC1_002181 [Eukaryota sp. GEM-RC1]
MGYAFAGRLAFGIDVYEYRSMKHASLSLFRIVVGDFDYDALFLANRVLGPTFLVSFMFLVFFVLLNMFLAIINDTFTLVREDESKMKEDMLLSTLGSMSRSVKRKIGFRLGRITDMTKNPLTLKTNVDERISEDSLVKLLNNRRDATISLFGQMSPSEVLAKFDSNRDGYLTFTEYNHIAKLLENESSKLKERHLFQIWQDSQFEKFKNGAAVDDAVIALSKRISRIEASLATLADTLVDINKTVKRNRFAR